jgi:hypothetical protein
MCGGTPAAAGSRWIPAGAGSVVSLWGQAGDPVIDVTHLKPVVATAGPWQMTIDGQTGEVATADRVDLEQQIRWRGTDGLTAAQAAQLIAGTDGKPRRADVERARRTLDKKVTAGRLVRHDGQRGRTETTWFLGPQGARGRRRCRSMTRSWHPCARCTSSRQPSGSPRGRRTQPAAMSSATSWALR